MCFNQYNMTSSPLSLSDVTKGLPDIIEVDNNLNHGETVVTFAYTVLDQSDQIMNNKYLVPVHHQPVTNNYFRIIMKPETGYVCE